ncbi:MAG: COX15/CtaA family protein [Pseudobdellovibrionaceae bacterium]
MADNTAHTHIITLWLGLCALMILTMTGIGAITRLTESGLSITEWNVVSGTLPPLSHESWQEAFDKYQKTPEFQQKHDWMRLSDFKKIFFWEWFHRLWGRMIGLVFALPLIVFWVKGWIVREDRLKFLGLLMLGGTQGALGWFMVKSGLVDRPSVSHFRLAAHLSLALIIYALTITLMVYLNRAKIPPLKPPASLIHLGLITLTSLTVTIIWGAFTAGLDAGMIYNSFPLMGEGLVPPELGKTPFLSDSASVQFTHRLLAILTGALTLTYAYRTKRQHPRLGGVIAGLVLLQISLGIATLLSAVMIPLAVMHQICAVLLLTSVVASLSWSIFSRSNIAA